MPIKVLTFILKMSLIDGTEEDEKIDVPSTSHRIQQCYNIFLRDGSN